MLQFSFERYVLPQITYQEYARKAAKKQQKNFTK